MRFKNKSFFKLSEFQKTILPMYRGRYFFSIFISLSQSGKFIINKMLLSASNIEARGVRLCIIRYFKLHFNIFKRECLLVDK